MACGMRRVILIRRRSCGIPYADIKTEEGDTPIIVEPASVSGEDHTGVPAWMPKPKVLDMQPMLSQLIWASVCRTDDSIASHIRLAVRDTAVRYPHRARSRVSSLVL